MASLPDIQILCHIVCIPTCKSYTQVPAETCGEHISLHWGQNVAAISRFDESAVDLQSASFFDHTRIVDRAICIAATAKDVHPDDTLPADWHSGIFWKMTAANMFAGI